MIHVAANPQLELAMSLAGDGLPVSATAPAGHRPLTTHGTTDAATIRSWWHCWPDALVTTATGAETGVIVLEARGEAGRQSLNELLRLVGLETIEGLSCAIAETPGGDLHLYFTVDRAVRIRSRFDFAPGVRLIADGGHVIAPGNRLPDGRQYRWIGGSVSIRKASPAPADLVALLNPRGRSGQEGVAA